jgi:hypothetical protein
VENKMNSMLAQMNIQKLLKQNVQANFGEEQKKKSVSLILQDYLILSIETKSTKKKLWNCLKMKNK